MKGVTVFVAIYLALGVPFGWLPSAKTQTVPDPHFGLTEAFWQPQEAAELGVGWERILFYWREIQPTGPDDWNTLHVMEEWLDEADRQGRTVVGLLKNTTPWASEDGTEAGLPKGLYLSVDDQNNLWAGFVRRIAEYYGERNVHHWIIWNEPEISPGVYGHEFAGSVADYYQLLKVAYKVMKEVDPEAVIHLAGLTWWHDQGYFGRLLEVAANDPEAPEYGYFFDVISLHIYFRPETIRTILNAVNAVQREYNLDKPVWINETNAPPNKDPLWPVNRPIFEVDLEQQAWYIVQAFALGFASGAERISVYKLIDIHLLPGDESFGLMRPDLSRRPAFKAYQQSQMYMRDQTKSGLETWRNYYHATFERPQALTHVLWTRSPLTATVQIPATTGSALLVEVTGGKRYVKENDGFFTVNLKGARCSDECLIGGPPIFLIEGEEYTDSRDSAILNRLEEGIRIAAGIVDATPSKATSVPESPTPVTDSGSRLIPMATATNVPEAPATAQRPIAHITSDNQQSTPVYFATPQTMEVAGEPRSNLANSAGLWVIGIGLGLAAGILVMSIRGRRN